MQASPPFPYKVHTTRFAFNYVPCHAIYLEWEVCNNIGGWQSLQFSYLQCCSHPIRHSTTQLTIVWQMTWSLHAMPFMRMSILLLISSRDPSFSSHKVALCVHEKEKEEEILKGFGKAVQPIIGCVSSCPSCHEWEGIHRSLVMMQSCVDLICVQFHPTPNKTIMETISSWLFCILNDATKKPITVNAVHSSWRGWGGESCYSIGSWAQLAKFSHDTSFGGFVFWSMGRPTKKVFFRWHQDHKSCCGEKL